MTTKGWHNSLSFCDISIPLNMEIFFWIYCPIKSNIKLNIFSNIERMINVNSHFKGNRSCIRLHMDMGGRDLSSMWTSVFGPDILYVFLCSLTYWYEPHSNIRLLITGGISLLYLSGCGNTGNIGGSTFLPLQIWYLR